MKTILVLATPVLFFAFSALVCRAEDWTVKDKTYHDVTVMKVDADTVAIMYDGGIAHLNLADLPPDLQKKFGYDPAKAAAPAQADQGAAQNPGAQTQSDSGFSSISNLSYYVVTAAVLIIGCILFRIPKYIVPLVCGLVLMADGINGLSLDEQFTGNVVHVSGVVDELGLNHGRGGPHYYLNYHYNNGSTERYVKYTPVSDIKWSQLHVGDPVWVQYLPKSPDTSRIEDAGEASIYGRDNQVKTLFGIVLVCTGLYMVFKKYVTA
jgi:hypothetical protein